MVEDEFAVSRRSFGSHRRVDRDGGCNRLWADRPVRKAPQAGEPPAARATSAGSCDASPARAGDSGSAELGRDRPCGMAGAFPSSPSTATLMLQSSGAGTTMNSLAAPDVRAPSVRGRWHFQSIFKRSRPPIRSRGRPPISPCRADTGSVSSPVFTVQSLRS
jgi:hypothetical protein